MVTLCGHGLTVRQPLLIRPAVSAPLLEALLDEFADLEPTVRN
jgi:hypothetical protein